MKQILTGSVPWIFMIIILTGCATSREEQVAVHNKDRCIESPTYFECPSFGHVSYLLSDLINEKIKDNPHITPNQEVVAVYDPDAEHRFRKFSYFLTRDVGARLKVGSVIKTEELTSKWMVKNKLVENTSETGSVVVINISHTDDIETKGEKNEKIVITTVIERFIPGHEPIRIPIDIKKVKLKKEKISDYLETPAPFPSGYAEHNPVTSLKGAAEAISPDICTAAYRHEPRFLLTNQKLKDLRLVIGGRNISKLGRLENRGFDSEDQFVRVVKKNLGDQATEYVISKVVETARNIVDLEIFIDDNGMSSDINFKKSIYEELELTLNHCLGENWNILISSETRRDLIDLIDSSTTGSEEVANNVMGKFRRPTVFLTAKGIRSTGCQYRLFFKLIDVRPRAAGSLVKKHSFGLFYKPATSCSGKREQKIPRVIRETGFGICNKTWDRAAWKKSAIRSAELDAKRRLIARIAGEMLNAQDSRKNYQVDHDRIETRLSGLIKNCKILEVRFDEENCSAEVDMEVDTAFISSLPNGWWLSK